MAQSEINGEQAPVEVGESLTKVPEWTIAQMDQFEEARGNETKLTGISLPMKHTPIQTGRGNLFPLFADGPVALQWMGMIRKARTKNKT